MDKQAKFITTIAKMEAKLVNDFLRLEVRANRAEAAYERQKDNAEARYQNTITNRTIYEHSFNRRLEVLNNAIDAVSGPSPLVDAFMTAFGGLTGALRFDEDAVTGMTGQQAYDLLKAWNELNNREKGAVREQALENLHDDFATVDALMAAVEERYVAGYVDMYESIFELTADDIKDWDASSDVPAGFADFKYAWENVLSDNSKRMINDAVKDTIDFDNVDALIKAIGDKETALKAAEVAAAADAFIKTAGYEDILKLSAASIVTLANVPAAWGAFKTAWDGLTIDVQAEVNKFEDFATGISDVDQLIDVIDGKIAELNHALVVDEARYFSTATNHHNILELTNAAITTTGFIEPAGWATFQSGWDGLSEAAKAVVNEEANLDPAFADVDALISAITEALSLS
jgi:hypothetical protein